MDYSRIVEAGIANNISEFNTLLGYILNERDALAHIKYVGREILRHHARDDNHVKFDPILRQLISGVIVLIEKNPKSSIVVYVGVLNSIIIDEDNYYSEFLSIINTEMYGFLRNKYSEVDTFRYLQNSIHHEVYALATLRTTNTPLLAMNKVLYGLSHGSYNNVRDLMTMPDKEFLHDLLDKIDIIQKLQIRKDSHAYSCDVRKNNIV